MIRWHRIIESGQAKWKLLDYQYRGNFFEGNCIDFERVVQLEMPAKIRNRRGKKPQNVLI